jgi:DnaJ-class molecular chaperone
MRMRRTDHDIDHVGMPLHQTGQCPDHVFDTLVGRKQAEGLARDYANLELKPGAAEEDVRKSYKRLLIKYHPDKFAGSPEKQAIATEVTTKLNESYKRIIEILKAGG